MSAHQEILHSQKLNTFIHSLQAKPTFLKPLLFLAMPLLLLPALAFAGIDFYRNWYVPSIVWFGNKLGGRAEAGRLGRLSRAIRTLGNLITLGTIVTVVLTMGLTAFWTGGAVLPLWAFLAVGAGITLNTIGWPIGSAANHLKIEQYYDAEMELQADNNDLRTAPEGLGHAHGLKKVANVVRTLHDINGVGGTAASYAGTVLAAITYFSAGAILFSPVIGAGLFVASRLSAWVSAFTTWGTNQIRLKANKNGLNQQAEAYYRLKAGKNQDRHEMILDLTHQSLGALRANNSHQYTPWVKLRIYKALDAALDAGINNIEQVDSNKVVAALTEALQGFITPSGKFSRDKLRQLGKPEVSVLDSLPLLESHLFEAVARSVEPDHFEDVSTAVNQFGKTRLFEPEQATAKLLCYQLKSSLLHRREADLSTQVLSTTCAVSGLFVTKKDKFAVDHTKADQNDRIQSAHGSALPSNRYGKKVAQAVVARIPSRSQV